MKQARSFRRHVLGALATAMLAAPIASTSGCSPGWVSSNLVDGLRVLGVTADKPYAAPGDEVTFQISYVDGYEEPDGSETDPVQVLWLGGCYNPPGDLYYGCFPQIAGTFQKLGPILQAALEEAQATGQPPKLPPEVTQYISQGDVFRTPVPLDIFSERPAPDGGSKYGVMYVFFAVCAGEIRPVELDPSGKAGFFPFGCFKNGQRLPASRFVPGFTQVYAFEDGRLNQNPAAEGISLDGEKIPATDEVGEPPKVARCASTPDERRAVGCFAGDPYEGCTEHEIDLIVEPTVAEIDPGEMVDGKQIFEAVWVDWLAEAGDITGGGISLVSGVTEGYKGEHSTKWIPPDEPGLVRVWGVIRDSRGGATVLERYIQVE